jgi:hypothetical protein
VLEIPKQKMQSDKCPISVIWGSRGIKSTLYVPTGMKYNITFFVELVVPELVEHVCHESRRKTFRGILIRLDNARPQQKSETALAATKARRIPTPAHSRDSSPSDFFLFGLLKERMSETSYSSPNELISAISGLIASLPKDQLVSIYKNRMKRLNWVIKHRGDYYRK